MLSEKQSDNHSVDTTDIDQDSGRHHVWQMNVTDFFKNLEFYKKPETEQS